MKKIVVFVLLIALLAVAFTACKASDVSEVLDAVGDKVSSTQVTLSAPENVRVEGGVLAWNPVEHATKYKVSIDGRENYADDFSYVLPNLVDGEHSFKVCALGDDVLYLSSAFSEPLVVTFRENAVTRTGYYSQFDDLTKEESFLGYGFDIINSSVFSDRYVKTSFPIFKTDELMNQRLLKVDSKSSYITEIESSDLAEFMQEWNVNANVDVSWGGNLVGGSVHVEANYSGGHEDTQYKYYHAISIYNQKFYIVMQSDIPTYQSILSDGFVRDLYSSMSPADLFNKYGTHFITSAVMGGKINSYYLYTSSETSDFHDVSASVSTQVRYWTVNVDVEVSGGYHEKADQSHVEIKNTLEVIGGGNFGMLSDSDIGKNYLAWENSLEDHCSLMGIKDSGSLVALWSLIDPSKDDGDYYWDYKDGNGAVKVSRAQQLEAYFYEYGATAYNNLMKSAGLPEIVQPTAITNVKVNGEDPNANGDYEVFSGTTNNITFSVEPENAIGAKSIGISTKTDYASLSQDGYGIVIDHDMPGDTILRVIISAGNLKKTIRLHVTSLCNVELRLNGGTLPADVQLALRNLPSGTWVEAPQTPTREGYTFVGWYTNPGLTDSYVESAIENDFFLYAKWEVKKPRVTFVTGFDDVIVDDVYTSYNGTISKPKDPTKNGFTFLGWYEDDVYSSAYDFSTNLVDDVTLYAKWEVVKYRFTFVTNGGTPILDQETTVAQNFSLSVEPVTARRYYTFGGWYKDESLLQSFNWTDSVTCDTTLYAKWDPKQVTIRFLDYPDQTQLTDKMGFQIANKKTDVTKDFMITAPATPAKDGFSFNCWYCPIKNLETEELQTAKFEPEDEEEYEISVFALWKRNNYDLIYVWGDSESETRIVSLEYESDISLMTGPAKEGYIFKNWSYSGGAIPLTMPAKSLTLTANYEICSYSITYMVEGEVKYSEAEHIYGTPISYKTIEDFFTFDELVDKGEFSGWSWNGSSMLPEKMPAADMIISGGFGDKYTIRFVVDEDSSLNKNVSAYYKNVIPTYIPVKEGYVFNGWTYNDGAIPETMPEHDITLHGTLSKAEYTITLDRNGGEADRVLTVKYGESLSSFDAITRTAYLLDGYYTALDSGVLVITKDGSLLSNVPGYSDDEGKWTKVGGAKLYAHWTANVYTVKYDGNKPASASGNVTNVPANATWTYDVNATLAAAPSLTGWEFVGWYRDAACEAFVGSAGTVLYQPNLTVEKSVTLYAKWISNAYVVSGTSSNGTVYWSTSSITTSGGSTTLSAKYDSTVYYRIAPATGYSAPSTSYGSIKLGGSNFTFNHTALTATKVLTACSAQNYTISGTSSNGTVYWSTSSITTSGGSTTLSAKYDSTVYYRIAPATGYSAPSTSYGSIKVSGSNFTFNHSSLTAAKALTACSAKNYTVTGTSTGGTVYWSTSSITTSGGSTTLSAKYDSTVYYRIAPAIGYNAPSTSYGSIKLTGSNFTFNHSSLAATQSFTACTPIVCNSEIVETTFRAYVCCESTQMGSGFAEFKVQGIKVMYNNEYYVYGNAWYYGNLNGIRFNDVAGIHLKSATQKILLGGVFHWSGSEGDNNESGVAGWNKNDGWNTDHVYYFAEDPSKDFAGNEPVSISITDICVRMSTQTVESSPVPEIATTTLTASMYCEDTSVGKIKFDVIGIKAKYNGYYYIMGNAYYNGTPGGKRFNDVGNLYLKNCDKNILFGGSLLWRGSYSDNNESGVCIFNKNDGYNINTIRYMMEDPTKDFAANEENIISISGICVQIGSVDAYAYKAPTISTSSFTTKLYCESSYLRGSGTFAVIGIEVSYKNETYLYGNAFFSGTPGGDRFNDVARFSLSNLSKAVLLGGTVQWYGSNSDNNESAIMGFDKKSSLSTNATYLQEDPSKDFPANEGTEISITGICVKK